MGDATRTFRAARDVLLETRTDLAAARARFTWPRMETFNWVLDWFDVLAAETPDAPALRLLDAETGEATRTFGELAEASRRVANALRDLGARRGDRLLLIAPNIPELWEAMLGAMRLGVVVIPATTLLTDADVADRVRRGRARHVVADAATATRLGPIAGLTRLVVGEADGWQPLAVAAAQASPAFAPDGPTPAGDPLLEYFTSGTTAQPKLVRHTQTSYPVGHLSTMYWLGLQPGDRHLNISSPGWAKHAWSSVFAPWNAGATVCVWNAPRFEPRRLLETLAQGEVTTLCAPPTVWRLLVGQDLAAYPNALREVASAGEPLNPEVIEAVRRAWGLTVRDGYGQTETTAQIGNPPGAPIVPGSMGRPLPGYDVVLLDPDGREADEGEVALPLDPPPAGLMAGYLDDAGAPHGADGRFYRTGDVARRDADGAITYVGRADDVFKSADYRISPFELESALIEFDAIAEAAVVPRPDPVRTSVPKAYVTLHGGHEPSAELARDVLAFCRARLAPYKRIRRVEFAELPKTISGKIRRVELRAAEAARVESGERGDLEWGEEDFPDLRGNA